MFGYFTFFSEINFFRIRFPAFLHTCFLAQTLNVGKRDISTPVSPFSDAVLGEPLPDRFEPLSPGTYLT